MNPPQRQQHDVGGSLVLDSEALALLIRRDRRLTTALTFARHEDRRVLTSAATLVEVAHAGMNRPTMDWALSRLTVDPVTRERARQASELLARAGVHGHRHAIDAMLAATALTSPVPATILTSDPKDLRVLVGGKVSVLTV